MRAMLVLFISGVLLAGCKHTEPSDSAGTEVREKKAQKASNHKKSSKENANETQVTAINETSGKIASVNSNLRFVIIDFSAMPLPAVDQRMGVYRQGQKVGEIKISSQSRNSVIAADLTAGEAKVGDEVRPE